VCVVWVDCTSSQSGCMCARELSRIVVACTAASAVESSTQCKNVFTWKATCLLETALPLRWAQVMKALTNRCGYQNKGNMTAVQVTPPDVSRCTRLINTLLSAQRSGEALRDHRQPAARLAFQGSAHLRRWSNDVVS